MSLFLLVTCPCINPLDIQETKSECEHFSKLYTYIYIYISKHTFIFNVFIFLAPSHNKILNHLEKIDGILY